MSTALLKQRLEHLNAAIHSGERTITEPGGSSVTYRSLDDMLRTRADILAQLDAANKRPRMGVVRATFSTLRGG